VTLEGPTELAPEAIATFRFVVQSNSPQQVAAGLNVAASAGTLINVTGQGTRFMSGEITHMMPKRNDANGQATFEFQWRAPSEPGSYTLFAAGNSVNLNGNNQGDRAAATTLIVQVVAAEPPTATPTSTAQLTPTPTVTELLATPTPSPTPTETPLPEPSPCAGDCDGSGDVTVDELVTGVNIALDLAPVERCLPMDSNRDGQVTIDELLQAVNAALFGCPL
jgi:hypothetical protein